MRLGAANLVCVTALTKCIIVTRVHLCTHLHSAWLSTASHLCTREPLSDPADLCSWRLRSTCSWVPGLETRPALPTWTPAGSVVATQTAALLPSVTEPPSWRTAVSPWTPTHCSSVSAAPEGLSRHQTPPAADTTNNNSWLQTTHERNYLPMTCHIAISVAGHYLVSVTKAHRELPRTP